MVYFLVMKKNRYVKVGSTDNRKRRKKEYETHNPAFKCVGILPDATIEDEKVFQFLLEEMGFKKTSTEWFKVPKKFSMKKIIKKGFLIFE